MGFNTHLVKLNNKVSNKVVTVVCRRLKIDDDAALVERMGLEISSWKPSASFVNLNGPMSISPSEEIAAAKRLSLAISNASVNYEAVLFPS